MIKKILLLSALIFPFSSPVACMNNGTSQAHSSHGLLSMIKVAFFGCFIAPHDFVECENSGRNDTPVDKGGIRHIGESGNWNEWSNSLVLLAQMAPKNQNIEREIKRMDGEGQCHEVCQFLNLGNLAQEFQKKGERTLGDCMKPSLGDDKKIDRDCQESRVRLQKEFARTMGKKFERWGNCDTKCQESLARLKEEDQGK